MAKIILDIKDCSECPFATIERVHTPDSWEMVYKVTCNKQNKVLGICEWNEMIQVPEVCPIIYK